MLRLFAAMGVDAAGMLVQPAGWNTPVYVKPIEDGAEMNRIDFGNANALDAAVGERLLATLAAALPTLDLVIVNQQLVHGIHTRGVPQGLAALLACRGPVGRSWPTAATFSDELRRGDAEDQRPRGPPPLRRDWDSEGDALVPLEDAERAAADLSARWGTRCS